LPSPVDDQRPRRYHGGIDNLAVAEWFRKLDGERRGRVARAVRTSDNRADTDAQADLVGGCAAHHARRLGHDTVRLDTREVLTEAIALYERGGYAWIERYNDNPHATHFFAKRLTSAG
jgi:hypothetical protein